MKRHKPFITIAAMGGLLVFISHTMAQPGLQGFHQARFASQARMLRAAIKPTPEQRKQMQEIRRTYHPQLKTARENLAHARQALRDALLSAEATSASLQKQIDAVTTAQADVIRLRTNMQLEINHVLTAEQLAKLKEFRAKVQGLNKEFRHRRRALMKEFVEPRSQ